MPAGEVYPFSTSNILEENARPNSTDSCPIHFGLRGIFFSYLVRDFALFRLFRCPMVGSPDAPMVDVLVVLSKEGTESACTHLLFQF